MVSDYDISNSVTDVYYSRLSHKESRSFLASSDKSLTRQHKAQILLDYLCEKYDIPSMRIYIVDIPQPKKNGTTFRAFYYFNSCSVRMFNLFPNGEVVPISSLMVTVLHEFMHHYDRYYLGVESTPHTRGFFSRIKDLKFKLTDNE